MLQGWLWGEFVTKWPYVERCLEAVAQADGAVAQSQQCRPDAYGVAQQAWWVWCKAEAGHHATLPLKWAISPGHRRDDNDA
jgi:hypothetical protein